MRGLQDGDTVRVSSKGNSIVTKIQVDDRVAKGSLVVPLGFEQEILVHELEMHLVNGMPVEISREAK